MNKKLYKHTKGKGDENMKSTSTVYPNLDIGLILGKGKQISSQEALKDVTPVEWTEDVLNGKYKEKNIIKSKEGEER